MLQNISNLTTTKCSNTWIRIETRSNAVFKLKARKIRSWEAKYWLVLPKQFCKKFRSWVDDACSPNLNCCAKLAWLKFRFGVGSPRKLKILSLSGLRWLEVWITFALRNTLARIPFSLMFAFLDTLDKPVLLVPIFRLTAYSKSREWYRLRFWRLRYRWCTGLQANSEATLFGSQAVKYLDAFGTVLQKAFNKF